MAECLRVLVVCCLQSGLLFEGDGGPVDGLGCGAGEGQFLLQVFPEDLLQGGIALTGGPHEAGDGDDGGLAEVDGSVVVELTKGEGTSATESWTEE